MSAVIMVGIEPWVVPVVKPNKGQQQFSVGLVLVTCRRFYFLPLKQWQKKSCCCFHWATVLNDSLNANHQQMCWHLGSRTSCWVISKAITGSGARGDLSNDSRVGSQNPLHTSPSLILWALTPPNGARSALHAISLLKRLRYHDGARTALYYCS